MSKLAQRLINKEIRLKTGSLNIGKCGLTEWPKALFDLVWLEELIVSDSYDDLEQGKTFSRIKSAGKKNIFPNGALPEDFRKLTELKTFYCQGYNTHINDISALRHCSQLRVLNLNKNLIHDISALTNLKNLQVVDLGYNKIQDISPLKNASHLRILNLNMNAIKYAIAIAKLHELEVLQLRWNKLETPLISFNNLLNLKRFEISNNPIYSIHKLKLFQLEYLNLFGTKINKIQGLEDFVNLKTLDLRANSIQDIRPLLPLLQKGLNISLDIFGRGDIKLSNNPITSPPISIIEKGNQAIIDYFEKNTSPLVDDNSSPSSSMDEDEEGNQRVE